MLYSQIRRDFFFSILSAYNCDHIRRESYRDNDDSQGFWSDLTKNSRGCNPGLGGRLWPPAVKRHWGYPGSWTGRPSEEEAHRLTLGAPSRRHRAAPPAGRAVPCLWTRHLGLLTCLLQGHWLLLWKPTISTYSEKEYRCCKRHIKSLLKQVSCRNGFFYH